MDLLMFIAVCFPLMVGNSDGSMPQPQTTLWTRYARCSQDVLPIEVARQQYGQTFKCANRNTYDEDQCGRREDAAFGREIGQYECLPDNGTAKPEDRICE
jgi:hypothetical protein